MQRSISELDRRRFLRGSGIALSLPVLTSAVKAADSSAAGTGVKRLACFYQPDGVPMPLAEDPAYQDWAWFPHGNGREFQLTKCLQPLESLRSEITVLSGFSHPAARSIHGHSNADQFLTGASTGPSGEYVNSISLDQEFAAACWRADSGVIPGAVDGWWYGDTAWYAHHVVYSPGPCDTWGQSSEANF